MRDAEPTHEAYDRAELARRIRQQRRQTAPRAPTFAVADIGKLTPAQLRIWLAHETVEDGRFNSPFVFRIAGRLNFEAAVAALRHIIERHEPLRTRYVCTEGDVVRQVEPATAVSIEIERCVGFPTRWDEVVGPYTRVAGSRRMDLTARPPSRFVFLRVAPDLTALVWLRHQIVGDGWSLTVFGREFASLYEQAFEKAPLQLWPLPVRYGDRNGDRNDDAGAAKADLAYWQRKLRSLGPAAEWFVPRSTAGTSIVTSVPLDPLVAARLRALSQAQKVSLFTVMLAGLKLLIANRSGRTRISVGTVTAGRTEAAHELLIGCFINTLVLSSDLAGVRTVRDLIATVSCTASEALEHGSAPYLDVVSALNPPRAEGRPTWFQTFFTLQAIASDAWNFAGLRMEMVPIEVAPAEHPLSIWALDRPDGMGIMLKAGASGPDREELENIGSAYLDVLHRLSSLDADAPVPLEPRAATPAASEPQSTTLLELLVASARAHPTIIAIQEGDLGIEYADLDRRSTLLASRLADVVSGVDPVIATYIERSIDLFVAVLAIMKSRAAFMVICPHATTPTRRRQLLQEGRPVAVIIADQRLEFDGPQIKLNERVPPPEETPLRDVLPLDIAHIAFTSGSTGRPHAVALTHEAIANRLLWGQATWPLGPGDVAVQKTALPFVDFVAESLAPLIAGATLKLAPPGLDRDIAGLQVWLAGSGSKRLVAVPALLRGLTAASPDGEGLALTLCFSSGEPLSTSDLDRFRQRFPPTRLVNIYGCSEVTADITWHEVTGEEVGAVPIGRPIWNSQVLVLNEELEICSPGVVGELYLGGIGLARGYLGRAALTAERFVPHPFAEGARLYRSGDFGFVDPQGRLVFVGRRDDQVKVRGQRIEMGEVEAHLASHPAVKGQAVIARRDETGEVELEAYIETDGADLTASALRAHLLQRLPGAMVPAWFQRVTALPLSPTGKIDRRRLAAERPGEPMREVFGPAQPIADGWMTGLADIWRELLGDQPYGPADDFFAVGGNSLIAVRLSHLVGERFAVTLPLREILRRPLLGDLAAFIAQSQPLSAHDPQPHDEETADKPFPLTEMQEAYWIGRNDAFALGGQSSSLAVELEFRGVDTESIKAAWSTLVRRHEALRCEFLEDARQRLLTCPPPPVVTEYDLRGAESADTELDRLRQTLLRSTPADRYPYHRLSVIRLTDNIARTFLTIDLSIVDAWSLRLLLHEFLLVIDRKEEQLAPPASPFGDCCRAMARQRELNREKARSFWASRPDSGFHAPELSLLCKPESLTAPTIVRRQAELEAAAWSRIKQKGAARRLTGAAILLTSYAEVLAPFSATDRFVLNLPHANRRHIPGVDRVVGQLSSFLPILVDMRTDMPFAARATIVQTVIWETFDEEVAGGLELLRALRRVQPGHPGWPVVMTTAPEFSLGANREPQRHAPLPEVTFSSTRTSQVWLDNMVAERGGQLFIFWDSVAELLDPAVVDTMFETFVAGLRALGDDDKAWDCEFTRPSGLSDGTGGVSPTTPASKLKRLESPFHTFALQAPRRTAVVTESAQVTYGDLSREVHRIAGTLPSHKVIGIYAHRSAQIAAALGILTAGSAYLPLDRKLPRGRIQEIVRKSGVEVILTDAIDELSNLVSELNPAPSIMGLDSPAAPHGTRLATLPAQDLCYVLFTSGSTGTPKGVMLQHNAVLGTLQAINDRLQICPSDRLLTVSSFGFDLSVYDVFAAFQAGATVVFPGQDYVDDPAMLAEIIEDTGVTIWNSVPIALKLLCDRLGLPSVRRFPRVRAILLSGDWVRPSLIAMARPIFPNARFIALGGATEAAIWSIAHDITDMDLIRATIPYGFALLGQSTWVLDGRLRPRPVGVTGEIFIGGAGLAAGYLNDPARTAERFIPNPTDGGRLYRTGDLGRYLSNGEIEFLGRSDGQVKIRGHRVEIEEIEAKLARAPNVSNAAVVATVAGDSEPALVAFVVLQDGGALDGVPDYLASALPTYMLPSRWLQIDALPLKANHKLDRERLLGLAAEMYSDGKTADTLGSVQQRVLAVVQSALKRDQLHPHDNLLQIGANSVDLIRTLNEVERAFKVRPSLRKFWEKPTVAALAATIEHELGASKSLFRPFDAGSAEPPKLGDGRSRRRILAEGTATVALRAHLPDRARDTGPSQRRTVRQFDLQIIPLKQLASVLSVLLSQEERGLLRRYASAGTTYAVQVYLHVKPDRIEGLAGGTYYLDPGNGWLMELHRGFEISVNAHLPLINQPVYESAALSIFLVCDLDAIAPTYGDKALHFATLEAGEIAQLLEMRAAEVGFGFCQIGTMDFDLIRAPLKLGQRHIFIHCLLGGAPAPAEEKTGPVAGMTDEFQRQEGQI